MAAVARTSTRHPIRRIVDQSASMVGFAVGCAVRFRDFGRQDAARRKANAVWLRESLQRLGPTYIKLGQFVTSRSDIFDAEIIDALELLQDNVEPIAQEDVRRIVAAASTASDVRTFQLVPIASASIGQVHVAELADGRQIAVKVRRPGIAADLSRDVGMLRFLFDLASRFRDPEQTRAAGVLLDDFRSATLLEADFTNEVSNMLKFEAALRSGPWPSMLTQRAVVVPRPITAMCDADAIVMELVPSRKVGSFLGEDPGVRRQLAYDVMDLFIGMMFFHGIVHGDPHEGNIGVNDAGAIVLYDFGNMISIDAALRVRMKAALFEIISGNIDGLVDVLNAMEVVRVKDESALRRYMALYLKYLETVDVAEFSVAAMQGQAHESLSTMPIELDGNVFQIMRAFAVVEGVCKKIDPEFAYGPLFAKYMAVCFQDSDVMQYKARSDVRNLTRQFLAWVEAPGA